MDTPGATPTKPKKVRKYEYDTITVREGGRPTPSSKYDFVKVKVWLEDHYYVLSRFLVSRVLNVTKVYISIYERDEIYLFFCVSQHLHHPAQYFSYHYLNSSIVSSPNHTLELFHLFHYIDHCLRYA
jgi:hypothetical protein